MCKDVPLTHLTRVNIQKTETWCLTLEYLRHFSQEKWSVLILKMWQKIGSAVGRDLYSQADTLPVIHLDWQYVHTIKYLLKIN